MKILKRLIGFGLCSFVAMCFFIGCVKADMVEQGYTPEPESKIEVVVATPAPIKTVFGFTPEFEGFIDQAAEYYGLPADLVRAVIWVESRGQINADNGLCVGLMQLNRLYDDTFIKSTGVQDIVDPESNVLCGCWWLSELLKWADGEENLALMAYNLGQSKALKKWQNGVVTSYVINVQEARSMFNA